jgi:superfamily I DNA and/or RNA helicase
MWERRGKRLQDLQVSKLVIDEASMMVFPHFLALATLIDINSGEIMLAGDHRQLAPIVAHDWENEDRPPVILYQPFTSAYEAIQNIESKVSNSAVAQNALRYTHRLPAEIRELISRLYRLDNIELEGRPQEQYPLELLENGWEKIWETETGLYLVTHNERESKLSNEAELAIVEQILASSGVQPADSIAIVTPHRGQRGLLKRRLEQFMGMDGPLHIIDTVERLQGGQRQTIIVSATESDPSAISTNAEFILDLRRSNVAFSRARMKLIVICSEFLLDYIPAQFEHYESTLLWKSLRTLCSTEVMSTELEINDNIYIVRIFTYTPPLDDIN